MAQALALSDNVYAVKTHLFLGEDTLVETAKRFWAYNRYASDTLSRPWHCWCKNH